jgi:hypothetical protein
VLSIFRTNKIIVSTLFIPYALILRSYGFFGNVPTDFNNGGLLSDIIYENIELNDNLLISLSLILILIQAVLITVVTNRQKLSSDRNLYPGVFYILLASLSTSFLGLTPALMGNTFLILALGSFFGIYNDKEPAGRHFNAGFWLAIAALFYGSLFLFFFFGILTINLMRAFNIKEMLQIVSGYAVPYILLFAFFYYIGDVGESYWAYLSGSFSVMDIDQMPSIADYVSLGTLGLLILWCFFRYGSLVEKKGIKTRKEINMLFLFMIFVGIAFCLQSGVGMDHFILITIPLSILVGILFAKMTKPVWMETWHLSLFLLVPICHYLIS